MRIWEYFFVHFFSVLFVMGTTLVAYGDATNCETQGTTHNVSNGKWWDGNFEQNCPSGMYCTGDGLARCCPEPFTTTHVQTGGSYSEYGATSVIDCAIKVESCITDHSADSDTITNLSSPIYIHPITSSDGYKVPTSCNSPYAYNVQRNNNESLKTKKAYAWHFAKYNSTEGLLLALDYWGAKTYTDDDSQTEYYIPQENYHWESRSIYDDTISGSGGTDCGGTWTPTNNFELKCVADTMPCSAFRNFPTSTGSFPSGGNDDRLDAIGANAEETPIQNSLSIPGTNCPDGSTVTGTATWDHVNMRWDVSNCKCDTGQQSFGSPIYCYGYGKQNADTVALNTTGWDVRTVHTIYENVIFTGHGDDEVACLHCKQDSNGVGYYVHANDFSNGIVSACTPSNQYDKGYYRAPAQTSFCNGSTNWITSPTATLASNPCPKVACPFPGTTTETGLPIGQDSCKYGDETLFCDANGCFNFATGTASNWTPNLP